MIMPNPMFFSPRTTQSGRAATKAGMISRKGAKTRRKETFSELCALASWREKIRVRKNLRKPRKFAVIVVRRHEVRKIRILFLSLVTVVVSFLAALRLYGQFPIRTG